MAAGLALDAEKLPEFRVRLGKTVEETMGAVAVEPTLQIDSWLDLSGVSLELAKALETLAPYGPGNEKPIMATRGLKLQSSATIGRNKEHRKLSVIDDAGNTQAVLWWNGAIEEAPEGRFDLAYTVRASDWRGTRQVQMEFVDFQACKERPIEVKPEIEIIDYRKISDPPARLKELASQPSTLIWAEGEEKNVVNGVDRNSLTKAEALAIWTTPASPEELRLALEKVQPKRIYLFAVTDPIEPPEAFLGRLAGLLKYAVNRRQGKVSYPELEAATAQRPVTVRAGLEWLVAQGQISLKDENENGMEVYIGTSLKDPASGSRLWAEIQSLLAETAAYRAHFKRADKDTLLP